MSLARLSTDADLSETSLTEAARQTGARTLCLCRVYCSEAVMIQARRLQAVWGFELMVFPEHLCLNYGQAWGVEYCGNHVWSTGVA